MKTAPPAPGRLPSMHVSAGFRAFVLDQLSGVDGLRARPMFGGVGLYAHDVFFGIVAADQLFFKTGETTRADYERAGSSPFRPHPGRAMTMPYYSVPVPVLEDAVTLREWALRAVAVAAAAKTRATTKTRKRPRRS